MQVAAVIPAEAVEAAAQGLASTNLRLRSWEELDDYARDRWRRDARAALEAAAPYMTGRAVAYLDEAVRMISTDPDVTDYERGFDDATRGMAAKVKRLLNGEDK